MQIRSSTGLQTFVTTVWNGVPIMVVWNNLASGIMQIWEENVVADEDLEALSNMINDFIQREL